MGVGLFKGWSLLIFALFQSSFSSTRLILDHIKLFLDFSCVIFGCLFDKYMSQPLDDTYMGQPGADADMGQPGADTFKSAVTTGRAQGCFFNGQIPILGSFQNLQRLPGVLKAISSRETLHVWHLPILSGCAACVFYRRTLGADQGPLPLHPGDEIRRKKP